MSPRRNVAGRLAALLALGVPAGLGLTGALASCAQTPPNNPVRSFERPEKVDFVCMQVRDGTANAALVPPTPVALSKCTPVSAEAASTGDAEFQPFHLYALVTQTTRGEVAVADLTAGTVVDHDYSAPGVNFLTVGALPRDIATTPDGLLSFVTAGEVNKPALYAIASHRILGDTAGVVRKGLDGQLEPPHTTLATWPACSLPDAPTSVTVLKKEGLGAQDERDPYAYQVAVLLPGGAGAKGPAKIVTLDVKPFLRGAGLPNVGLAPGLTDGPRVEPGSLAPCPVVGVVELGGAALVPPVVPKGPAWDDGVKYRAAAAPLPDPGPFPAGQSAVEPLPFSASCLASPAPTAPVAVYAEPLGRAAPTGFVRDGTRLYVGDAALPLIHVVDLSNPTAPRELAPLLTSSLSEPSRLVTVKDLAISPETRDYKRFLYAIDDKQGSLLVYDVTDDASPRVPLTRPHPQSNPFAPTDRVQFSAPVVAVQFARYELPQQRGNAPSTGALCNPNPAIGVGQGPFSDPGGFLRPSFASGIGPGRLRGVFAFATLTNGQIVTVDVDDWDAPCRRPDPMAERPTSATTPAEPGVAGSRDPYHTPKAFAEGDTTSPVTLEAFFPVSAPNRVRSLFTLNRSGTGGNHAPVLAGQPQLFSSLNAQLSTVGPGSEGSPKILPTRTDVADPGSLADPLAPNAGALKDARNDGVLPALPSGDTATDVRANVRFSYEDPTVHVDQDWATVYEGVIPTLDGVVATVASGDGFRTLTLAAPAAQLCSRGVEDFALGSERARAVSAALEAAKLPAIPLLERRMTDYAEITDDLLPPTDPYWLEDQACWPDELAKGTATARFAACDAYFDGDFEPDPKVTTTPKANPNRHLPILEAYDGRLVVSRFFTPLDGPEAGLRRVVPPEVSNQRPLALAQCCFHSQWKLRVRAGNQWITKGANARASVQFLHHVKRGAADRCVQSCEARDQLLSSRAPAVPFAGVKPDAAPGRNSPLAMRNPMFSFVAWNGVERVTGGFRDLEPARDTFFRYSTRGQFTALTANMSTTSVAVNPRAMRYVEPLGQIAIIDGASQGLVLFDLRTVTLSRTSFF